SRSRSYPRHTTSRVPRRHRRAALRKAREVVPNVEPRDALLGPNVVLDSYPVRFVEAADAHLYPIPENVFTHGDGTAAGRAKAPRRILRGAVPLWLGPQPRECRDGEKRIGESRRARVFAAHRTVTNHTANGSHRRPISDRSAQASALEAILTHSPDSRSI